ncbi:MAG: adenylyl-sulfate kinase [Candidatus Thioglobus sp.]
MVVWIIGLSGAGKTTLASQIVTEVQKEISNVVLVDGDIIREMFGNDLGHSMVDRRKNADRICQLCKFLDDQGINVVCAILSLFPESRSWNRKNLKSYYEVFIDVPVSDLMARDIKGIYKRFNSGELSDVAGMDIDFPRPVNADLIIKNTDSNDNLLSFSPTVVDKIMGR